MTSDKTYCERIVFVTWPSQLARVDEWRRRQNPIPSRNEAMRTLLDFALDVKEREKREDAE